MKISFPSQRVFNLGFWWEPSDRPLSSVASSLSWRAGDWGTSSGAVFRLNCFYFGKHQSLLLTPSTDCIKSTISWFKCWLPLRKYVLRSACQRTTNLKRKCTILWNMSPYSYVTIFICQKLNIYATCSTFMTLEGKTRLTLFSPFNHSQCFSARRLLLQNARGWVVYKPRYLSQFWRLEVQDQGASMVAWVRASVRTNP